MSKKFLIKEYLSNLMLEFIYESKKILTSYSLQQYFLYEYYQAKKIEMNKRKEMARQKQKIQKTIYYLAKAGYINYNKKGNISLSQKGFLKIILLKSKRMKTKKQKDKYFYLVVFDIPEKQRRIRNLFRRALYNFGAERLQKSVFIIQNKGDYLFIKDLVKKCNLLPYVKFIKCIKLES